MGHCYVHFAFLFTLNKNHMRGEGGRGGGEFRATENNLDTPLTLIIIISNSYRIRHFLSDFLSEPFLHYSHHFRRNHVLAGSGDVNVSAFTGGVVARNRLQ